MPRQTVLLAHTADVKPGHDGIRVLELTDLVTGDSTLFPMTPDLAETIGTKLIAPSIETVRRMPGSNNGFGPPH